MYVKVTNGAVDQFPYTIGQLRRDNPGVSFPKVIPEAMLADWGVYPVTAEDEPSYDNGETVDKNSTPALSDGSWTLGWTKRDKTQGEIDDAAAGARSKRNSLLANSDWTQMADSPLTDAKKAEWATYRTALRDLPTHANWPDLGEDDWPTQP